MPLCYTVYIPSQSITTTSGSSKKHLFHNLANKQSRNTHNYSDFLQGHKLKENHCPASPQSISSSTGDAMLYNKHSQNIHNNYSVFKYACSSCFTFGGCAHNIYTERSALPFVLLWRICTECVVGLHCVYTCCHCSMFRFHTCNCGDVYCVHVPCWSKNM